MDSFPLLPFVLHTIVSPQMSVAILGVNSLPGWILRAHGQAGGWDQPCSVFACVFSLLGWSEVPRCGDGEETKKGVFEREGWAVCGEGYPWGRIAFSHEASFMRAWPETWSLAKEMFTLVSHVELRNNRRLTSRLERCHHLQLLTHYWNLLIFLADFLPSGTSLMIESSLPSEWKLLVT